MKIKKIASLLLAVLMLLSAVSFTSCSTSSSDEHFYVEALMNLENAQIRCINVDTSSAPEIARRCRFYSNNQMLMLESFCEITVFNDVKSAKIYEEILKCDHEKTLQQYKKSLANCKEMRNLATQIGYDYWDLYNYNVTSQTLYLAAFKDWKVVRRGNVVYYGDSRARNIIEGKTDLVQLFDESTTTFDLFMSIREDVEHMVDDVEGTFMQIYFDMFPKEAVNIYDAAYAERDEYIAAGENFFQMTNIAPAWPVAADCFPSKKAAKITADYREKNEDLSEKVFELEIEYLENVLDKYNDEMNFDLRQDKVRSILQYEEMIQELKDSVCIQSGYLVFSDDFQSVAVAWIINIPFVRKALANM